MDKELLKILRNRLDALENSNINGVNHILEQVSILVKRIEERNNPLYKHIVKFHRNIYVDDLSEFVINDKTGVIVKVQGFSGFFVLDNLEKFRSFMIDTERFKSSDEEIVKSKRNLCNVEFYMAYQVIKSDECQRVIVGCDKSCNIEEMKDLIKKCFNEDVKINPNDLYNMNEIVFDTFVDKFNHDYYYKLVSFIKKYQSKTVITPENIKLIPEETDVSGIKYRLSSIWSDLSNQNLLSLLGSINTKIDKIGGMGLIDMYIERSNGTVNMTIINNINNITNKNFTINGNNNSINNSGNNTEIISINELKTNEWIGNNDPLLSLTVSYYKSYMKYMNDINISAIKRKDFYDKLRNSGYKESKRKDTGNKRVWYKN